MILSKYQAIIASTEMIYDNLQVAVINDLQEIKEYIDVAKQSWFNISLYFRKKPIKGLYIYGPVGRGKSMLMQLFYENCHVKRKHRFHFSEFMRFIHQEIRDLKKSNTSGDIVIIIAKKMVGQYKLICLDEFEIHDVADSMLARRILIYLLEHGVVMVFTSNAEPRDLYKNGMQREKFLEFIYFLEKNIKIVSLNSPNDYREITRDSEVHFFTQDDSYSMIMEKFNEITKGAALKTVEIDVDGRLIRLGKYCNDMALFDFLDLCEKPFAINDYQEIAKRFKCIFVTNITKINKENKDIVKRFILLIDALYDAQVLVYANFIIDYKLFKPNDINVAGWPRMLSRLNEMATY